MESYIDVSTKDDFNFLYVILHKNTTHVGSLNSDYMRFEMHNLERAFLSCSVQTRIPSIPYGHSGLNYPSINQSNAKCDLYNYIISNYFHS